MNLTALALVGALGTGQAAAVLPGYADLPLLPGASVSPACFELLGGMGVEGSNLACLEAEAERANDLAWEYGREAQARGWRWGSGAANVIWYERPKADGGCDRLSIMVFWDFQKSEEPPAGEPLFIALAGTPEPCQPGQP